MSQEGSLPSLSNRWLSVIELLLSMYPFQRILWSFFILLYLFDRLYFSTVFSRNKVETIHI